ILNAITSYYQLISQENQVKLAREELRLTQDLLALSQARLEADQIARLDLMQVKVAASSDEAKLIEAENSFKNSNLTFCRLLDLPIDSKILIPEEALVETVIFSSLTGLSKEAAFEESLKNRIDIKGQQINIDLAGLNLDISGSENKPALTFAGNYKWKNDKEKIEDIDREMDREWEVSALLNFPLLDGGLTRENVKAARLKLKKAKYDYEELLKSIRDETAHLFEDIQAEKRRLDILNLNLKLAEESSKITKLKYQQGMETAIEVLRSQISLFQMKNSINEALITLFVNKAKLLKAMGRLEIEYESKIN
ncbi:TolC family protein, partial [bacterium]|nr:TolC family protein [bacterium]